MENQPEITKIREFSLINQIERWKRVVTIKQ